MKAIDIHHHYVPQQLIEETKSMAKRLASKSPTTKAVGRSRSMAVNRTAYSRRFSMSKGIWKSWTAAKSD